MRVLVVSSWPEGHEGSEAVGHTVDALERVGNDVDLHDLDAQGFAPFMSEAERLAYETDDPLIDDMTRAAAGSVQRAEGLVFCHPSMPVGVPPRLKGWLERVMVPGVAFTFDSRNKLQRNLVRVRRLAQVTVGDPVPARQNDLGWRIAVRSLRLNCNTWCRSSRLAVNVGAVSADSVHQHFAKWG